MMKKILVIGIKGMAGHVVFEKLPLLGNYQMFGLARNIQETDNVFNVDVVNTELLTEIIYQHKFDVIVNCIGVLNKDAEDNPEKAIWFNAYFPHFLEGITKQTNTKLIHISTDCVFSGKKGGYTEEDFRDGIGFYAQSKALGEVLNSKDLTIRTSIIGPELNVNGIGLFHWFITQDKSTPLKGFSQAFWSGITTIELAKVIHHAIEKNTVGLIQISREKIDKYTLLMLFNDVFRSNEMSITSDDSYKVDKSLLSNLSKFGYSLPSYKEMLIEMKDWILERNYLYNIE